MFPGSAVVAQVTVNHLVVGSNPTRGAFFRVVRRKIFMKKQTYTNLILRSSLALVLALAIWSSAQAQSADIQIKKKGYVQDIESIAIKNNDFRRVLYTAEHCQLVVMSLMPKEEIGAEVHKQNDQFFRVEEGAGVVVLNGVRTAIRSGFAIVVPAGTMHNIINTGSVPLKLYTLYSPPNHRDGVVHRTRLQADADNEHFDGKTTE